MLCELFIENLAVIEKASIRFDKGFNVFTGETGAGKSIVIDAINAVLGQRTSKDVVRHGTAKASVTAMFRELSSQALKKLSEYGYETEDDQLIITREISADAKGSARIMGRPVTVGILKEIGSELINIHGQHDNQVLLAVDKHIDILDMYGDFSKILEEYRACYRNVVNIKREMKKISVNEQEKAQKIDLLSYQIDEITSAELSVGEDEELEEKQKNIKYQEKIVKALGEAHSFLSGDDDEGGAVELCKMAARAIEEIIEYHEPLGDLYGRLDGLCSELDEITFEISNTFEDFDFNPEMLNSINDRLAEINQLKRKYGDTVQDILLFCDNARLELEGLTLSDKRLAELNEEGTNEYKRLLALAEKVTNMRSRAAKKFINSVKEELVFLDMPNVSLEVHRDKVKPNSKGQDSIEFLISTNTGEPPKPIAKIASGGELSRIMLAIKNTLADKDEIQTLIFDEIDTGVSGRAAQKIGLKLLQASHNRQIISVTHLAQIAALADHHFLIQKKSDDKSTYTSVEELSYDGRVHEVARIMSTDKITDLMLKNAEEMINSRNS